jgi:uncharacterized protein YbjT (DUF2867 family)
MKKQAIIFGATGAVGRQLLNLCLDGDRYQKVTVIARRPASFSHEKLNWLIAELDALNDMPPTTGLLDGDAFCCLGTTIKAAGSKEKFRLVDYGYVLNTARFSKRCGVRSFSMITAIGADAKSNTFYNQTKGDVEAAVIAEHMHSLHIFRPSLLKGKRDDFRLTEEVGNIASMLMTPIFCFGLRKYQPIAIEKLARGLYVTAAEKTSSGSVRIYESDELQSY